jgi:pimeloyl-ACP methyl ester carboxylesterase
VSEASYAVIPGGGGAGLTWAELAAALPAVVLRAPDEPTIEAMAAGLEGAVSELPRPRVLIGASMGALVAIEVARRVEIDALALIACGWGIEVSDSVIAWMESNPPDIHQKLSRICLADREDEAKVQALVADYDAGGHERHIRQVKAMHAYEPQTLPDPPPTVVIWGMQDSAVPLENHVELALRCGGALAPVAGAAHVPFLEQPEATLRWIRAAAMLGATARSQSTA